MDGENKPKKPIRDGGAPSYKLLILLALLTLLKMLKLLTLHRKEVKNWYFLGLSPKKRVGGGLGVLVFLCVFW